MCKETSVDFMNDITAWIDRPDFFRGKSEISVSEAVYGELRQASFKLLSEVCGKLYGKNVSVGKNLSKFSDTMSNTC